MSQEVSLRGTGRAIFAGILLIIGGDDLLAALEFGALTAGGRRVDRPGAA